MCFEGVTLFFSQFRVKAPIQGHAWPHQEPKHTDTPRYIVKVVNFFFFFQVLQTIQAARLHIDEYMCTPVMVVVGMLYLSFYSDDVRATKVGHQLQNYLFFFTAGSGLQLFLFLQYL